MTLDAVDELMPFRRGVLGLLVSLVLAACAAPAHFATSDSALILPEAGLESELARRLVGRWEGDVDMTITERTLLIPSVRRQDGRWLVEAQYGVTNVNLTPVVVALDTTGGRVQLRFVSHLGSPVSLTLQQDGLLRGGLRQSNEARERAMELRRVSASAEVKPGSTAVERVSAAQRAREAGAPHGPAARTAAIEGPSNLPPAAPVLPSALRDLAADLPPLLVGRWDGAVELQVAERSLLIDSVTPQPDGRWKVQARYGFTEKDAGPVPTTLDLSGDRVVIRFVTQLASRVSVTLHADQTLRGSFAMPFDARDRRLEMSRAVPAEQAEPLAIAFRYLPDQSRVADPGSVVAAIVTSGKGVARVSVALNGAEVHQRSEAAPPRSTVLSVPVTFREGPNVITITASEPGGAMRQEVRTIIYDPRAGAASVAPASPPPAPRERWAVVIGVGQYDHAGVPRLRYATADAEAVHQILLDRAGFKKENVLLLTDRTERKPSLRNLRYALGTFLARSARKDDTVLIYFAGHGAPETDLQGAEKDGLAKYLIPSDADPDDLYASALPMDEIQIIFGRIEAERVLVFLDTCYSGAAGGRTFASRRTRAVTLDEAFLDRLTRSKGRAIVTASRPGEVSLELPELGHGIFTYYLIEGLKGAADLNRDGIVSLQELYEYLEREVTRKSRAVGGNQHPVMKGELEGVLPIVQVKP